MTQVTHSLPPKQHTDITPLVTTLSHDLKSLLTSIKAYGQILEKRLAKSTEQEAHTYSKKLNNQINLFTDDLVEYLDIMRIHSKALLLSKELIFFDDLISDIVSSVEKKHPAIIWEGKTEQYINGNKKHLTQVITTLLDNAVKHAAKDSPVILHLKADAKQIIVVVENEGEQLNKEKIDALFHLSEDTSSAGSRVSGTSLFIAQAIIQAHEGQIGIDIKDTKKTRFFLTLPIVNEKKERKDYE